MKIFIKFLRQKDPKIFNFIGEILKIFFKFFYFQTFLKN